MSTLIPRAEIHAIAEKYNDGPSLPEIYADDKDVQWVQERANWLRSVAKDLGGGPKLLAEADDLDALATRYEGVTP